MMMYTKLITMEITQLSGSVIAVDIYGERKCLIRTVRWQVLKLAYNGHS